MTDENKIKIEKGKSQSAEILSTIFDLSSEAIAITRVCDGEYIDCNQEYLNQIGYNRWEVIGHTSQELNLYTDKDRDNYIGEVLKKRTLTNFEVKVRRKDGVFITVLYSARIIDLNGEQALLNIGKNITEQKILEHRNKTFLEEIQIEKEKLSSLINSIPDEVWFIDKDKKFTLANPSALNEFGLKSSNVDVEDLSSNLEVYNPDGEIRPVNEAPPIRALKGEFVKNIEEIVRTPSSNELRYRQVNASPVKDKNGNIIGAVYVVRDITEQKRNEQALIESEAKYRNMVETANEGILMADTDGILNFANLKMSEMLGYPIEELIGTDGQFLIDKNQSYDLHEKIQKRKKGIKEAYELKFLRKDGSELWVLASGSPIYDHKALHIGNLAMYIDITERKIAEQKMQGLIEQLQEYNEELKLSNEKLFSKTVELQKLYIELNNSNANLQAVLDIAPIVLWTAHDPDCNVITGNKYADQIVMNVSNGGNISASAKEDAAVTYKVFHDGEELKPEELPAQMAASTGKPVPETELELVFPDERKVQLLLSAVPLFDNNDNVRGSLTAGVDITRIKRTRNALIESEERLRLAQTLGNVGIWDWNTVTNELYFTPELEKLYGLIPRTIKTYNDWRQLTHPDDIKNVEEVRDQKIANHEPFDLEFRIIHKSDEMRWLSAKGGAIYDNEGNVLRVLGINTDISERKIADKKIQDLIEQLQQANKEYEDSEDRFKTLADNIPNLAWMADANGWIFWYNKQWYEYTGTTFEEMQGWGWQKVHHPDYVQSVTEEWETKIRNIEPYDNIFPLKGKEGNFRWFLTRVTPIRDDKGNLIRWFGTNTDITDRVNREEELEITMNELERSNKELEQFAYITSHDLREPLRMITSFLQLLELRYKDQLDQDANDFIGFAVDGAKRLDEMTRDLLQYSKITSEKRENKPVNFEHVLENAIKNLKVQIEENDAVITHDPLPTIMGDEKLKVQLFQNLIGNAIKYRSQETPKIHISASKEKKQYLFSIKDNGIGISKEYLDQIFTIFKRLHTHDEYEGTGIGLSIAQKILNQQGGQIWVESKVGNGTTFYFTIPINK